MWRIGVWRLLHTCGPARLAENAAATGGTQRQLPAHTHSQQDSEHGTSGTMARERGVLRVRAHRQRANNTLDISLPSFRPDMKKTMRDMRICGSSEAQQKRGERGSR